MFTIFETPADFAKLTLAARELSREILTKVGDPAKTIQLSANTNLYDLDRANESLYLITGGNLGYVRNDKTLFYFDAGEFVGLDEPRTRSVVQISAEFLTTLDVYPKQRFYGAVRANDVLFQKWEDYRNCQAGLVLSVLSAFAKETRGTISGIKLFETGQTIIEQGTESNEVYTLMEGHAEVFRDGVKIGDIYEDEVFGALGALTDTKRTASVVAARDSMAIAAGKEEFTALVESRPKTVFKLLQDMARIINDLNKKVVDYQLGKTV